MSEAPAASAAPVVSVVMCTYNRADLLGGAIASVLDQAPGTPAFELLVVDNNSTDGTAAIVAAAARRDARVRPLVESKQGLSHARNAGIAQARGRIVTFTDDDVRADASFVAAVARAFAEHPDVDFAGGKVLPMWPAPPPAWLTPAHWGPLALVDYGDRPIRIDSDRSICLVGANLSVRRAVFDAAGTFTPAMQRVRDGIGSLEDHEFQLRLHRQHRVGLYDPRIVIHADVQPDRLQPAYHRRWHTGHGHFHALLRADYLESSGAGTVWGVPAHLYRQAAADLGGLAAATIRGDRARALHHEGRLRFFRGFWRTRRRQARDGGGASLAGELRQLTRHLVASARGQSRPPVEASR